MNLDSIFAEHAPKFSNLPPRSEVPDSVVAKLNRPVPQDTDYHAFLKTCMAEEAEAAAANDLTAPLWLPEGKHGWCGIDIHDEADRIKLRTACAVPWGEGTGALELLEWLVKWSPQWLSMPRTVTEKNDDFAFARLRTVLAGAGYPAHAALVANLSALWPNCPLAPEETEAEWKEALDAAHKTCGWAVTLALAAWGALPDEPGDWLDLAAWAHVRKHCRRDGGNLVILHRGSREVVPAPRVARSIGQWKSALGTILRALGGGSPKSAKYDALLRCLNQLGLDDLPAREPTVGLPGSILHGPWSTLAPAPAVDGEFAQPECRLEGVWVARGGKIGAYEGDSSDVLDWAWNLEDARTPERRAQQAQFERMMPTTYALAYPSDLIAEWFPHWILPSVESERIGYQCMLDAVFLSSVLRADRPELAREFPLVAILPVDPTAEDSTNQGKGTLCQAIGTAFALGLPLVKALNSNSAPDFRAVAGTIRTFGTIALDEFQMPASQAHPLSRDNLQTLCTGGRVASGLVYENQAELRLQQSIVVNAKWLDLADDLKNRTLPLFLGALSDEQRAKTTVKDMIERGEGGLRLRLAAVALAETIQGLPALSATKDSWRFSTHRAIAAALYVRRVGGSFDEAGAVLDALGADLIQTLAQHQIEADASGLSASTASGTNLRISWPAFWVGVDITTLQNIAGTIAQVGESRHGVPMIPVGDLIRLRLEQAGVSGHALAKILPLTMGADIRASNGAVTRAWQEGVRQFFASYFARNAVEWTPMPGDLAAGWECLVIPRSYRASDPYGRTVMCAIRPRKGTP